MHYPVIFSDIKGKYIGSDCDVMHFTLILSQAFTQMTIFSYFFRLTIPKLSVLLKTRDLYGDADYVEEKINRQLTLTNASLSYCITSDFDHLCTTMSWSGPSLWLLGYLCVIKTQIDKLREF